MATPAAVRKQAEEADRIHAELYGVKNETSEGKPEGETGVSKDTEGSLAGEKESGESVAPVSEEQPDGTVPAQAEPLTSEEWEQMYKSLAGKYEAEIPKLTTDLENTQAMMAAMAERNTENVAKLLAGESLTPEEIEEYGEDLVGVMRKAARAEMAPFVQQMHDQQEEMRNRMSATAENIAVSSREQFFQTLKGLVPDWEDINKSPIFLDWLKVPDVYSGLSRQQMLTQAVEANDISRAVAFFNGFKQEQTGQIADAPAASTAQVSTLETLVAPGRPAGTVATGAQPSGKVWTEAQVARFTRDKMAGKVPAADAARIDQEIHHAAITGRLRKA